MSRPSSLWLFLLTTSKGQQPWNDKTTRGGNNEGILSHFVGSQVPFEVPFTPLGTLVLAIIGPNHQLMQILPLPQVQLIAKDKDPVKEALLSPTSPILARRSQGEDSYNDYYDGEVKGSRDLSMAGAYDVDVGERMKDMYEELKFGGIGYAKVSPIPGPKANDGSDDNVDVDLIENNAEYEDDKERARQMGHGKFAKNEKAKVEGKRSAAAAAASNRRKGQPDMKTKLDMCESWFLKRPRDRQQFE